MKRWGARQGSLPNLHHLLAFEASVRLGSFRAAADEMHLTQGAIAQQVRALEAELRCALFRRHARGLEPTPAALDYANRIRLAMGVVEEATRELVAASSEGENRLTLSTTPSFASRWLIPRLTRLAEAHPDIALMIDASNTTRPLKGPGRVDLAIRWASPPFPDAHSRHLLHARLVPVCAPALVTQHGLTSAGDLAHAPLITDGHNRWAPWFDAFAQGTPNGGAGPVFTQTSLAIEAAEQGLGVALAPRLLVEDGLARGSLVLAVQGACELDVGAGFYLLTASPAPADSPAGKVIGWLIDEAQAADRDIH
ncbi:LysR substrate-binding domain-containing protein [Stutzerimonas chloritidismutans]|uniref:LysR substrate-binding domain-containing protein n=1 Tax=Stutzerimonas chloritidismutans TaxID=203192 RepID=UPI003F146C55